MVREILRWRERVSEERMEKEERGEERDTQGRAAEDERANKSLMKTCVTV